MKPKRLGRGLSGLLSRSADAVPPGGGASPAEPRGAAPALGGRLGPASPPPVPGASGTVAASATDDGARRLPLSGIKPNPFQPRTAFDEAALQELADSIRAHGLLQPIVVRRGIAGYEVLAGERRLRAAKLAGLSEIPAIVRAATDEEMQTLALVENVQREDLNAMEKARALRSMMGNFSLTQEQVAERVGKARTTIANILRLLDLPGEIQRWVEEGRLSGAQARALLLIKGTEKRLSLARLAVELGLSVREIERRAASESTAHGGPTKSAAQGDPFLADLAGRLQRALGAKVRLVPRGKGGRIEIRYQDAHDLDRLLETLKA